MAKTKISEWDSNPNNNTDIDSINIAEGCAPSGINNAIRELMSQVKDLYAGTSGDTLAVAGGGTGAGTASGARTNLGLGSMATQADTSVDINGGNIDGTAIGASSASTGAFTTLSASGNVTLSGGTANGVMYANGSKVVTTGSALTFDGTEFKVNAASGNVLIQPINVANAKLYMRHGSIGNNNGFEVDVSGNTIFLQAGSEAMRLTSTGLGIGTSSPSSKLEVTGDIAQTWAASMDRFVGSKFSTTYELGLHFLESSRETRIVSKAADSSGLISFYTGTAPTERMRIDSSGNLLNAWTSLDAWGTNGAAIRGPIGRIDIGVNTTAAAARMYFGNPNGVVGQITTVGFSTAYVTSSDYRLKENIQPMTGALAKVAALKPCTYKWKVDGSDGEGFIAHELAEVVPQCVTGEKDAVDDEGKPVYQGIDTSFLVATLTAAIQELKAEFDAYKASHP